MKVCQLNGDTKKNQQREGTAIKLTTVPLFVTIATSVATFNYLVCLNVDVAPVIGWN